jgi:hypothetical protein
MNIERKQDRSVSLAIVIASETKRKEGYEPMIIESKK